MQSCLICDDHPLVRDALAMAVALGWPACAVRQAASFTQAWASAEQELPDLILADLAMPGAEPLDGIARLRTIAPAVPLLVVTGTYDDAMLMALLDRGVAGVVPKTASSEIISAAITLALSGGRYLPERVAQIAADRRVPPPPALTPRQWEIAALMADGQTNKQIAQTLQLSPATVKTHVAQILATLGAANRTDAAVRIRALGPPSQA